MITNKHGLPDPIVRAVQGFEDEYQKGHREFSDISVTSLINPPQLESLKGQHNGHLVEDASDRIWALMGSAVHRVLEHSAEEGAVIEARLFTEVCDWTLSGQLDYYKDGMLNDYKFASVWESIYGLKPERAAQLNVLAYLCQVNKMPVERIQIVAIHRDWSPSKAKFEANYPPQVKVIDVDLWSETDQLLYIAERIALHKLAREGGQVPCTPEDRWHQPDTWAVTKKGRKRALRVLESEEEAREWAIAGNHALDLIEFRPGEDRRCSDYCPVSSVCPQWGQIQAAYESEE